jgi:single-strand DNA-binding protein
MHHQTIVIGNFGKDPEMRYLPNGSAVAEFSVAANEKFKRKDGTKVEHTEWYNCRCYGKLAELVGEYRKAGDLVFIQGRMHTDTWEKDGQPHRRVMLNVDTMRGMGSKSQAGRSTGHVSDRNIAPQRSERTGPPAGEDFNDDIPF